MDGVPVRVFKNHELGGRIKTNWSAAPFVGVRRQCVRRVLRRLRAEYITSRRRRAAPAHERGWTGS